MAAICLVDFVYEVVDVVAVAAEVDVVAVEVAAVVADRERAVAAFVDGVVVGQVCRYSLEVQGYASCWHLE